MFVMASNDTEILKEINHKLDIIIDNSFLSKIDLMFSVLLSLTILASGFISKETTTMGLFFPVSIGFLVLFVCTLVGEFWAILTDDAIMRFGFWIAFVPSLVLLLFAALFVVFPLSSIVSGFFWFLFMIGWIWKVEALYEGYRKKLRSRQLPHIGTIIKRLLMPTILDLLAFGTALCVALAAMAFL